MPETVGDACDERRLGADHDEVDVERARQGQESFTVVRTDRMTRAELRDSRIAGRGVELVEVRALAQLPGERVFASARPDDEDPHRRRVY